MIVAWIVAVWLLSLLLFVLLVERRTRVPRRHPKPPVRRDKTWKDRVA